MYQAYPLKNSALEKIYIDLDFETFLPCKKCGCGHLRAQGEKTYVCDHCAESYSPKELGRSSLDFARDQLRVGQELFTFFVHEIQHAKRLCQKAGRTMRAQLKKGEDLQLEKELADLYYLQAHTYAAQELYYDEIPSNYPKARDFLKKEIELREKILEKEPSLTNRFLLGRAFFDLGDILEGIRRAAGGPENREKGIALIEQCLKEADELNDPEFLEEIQKRALYQYYFDGMETYWDWFWRTSIKRQSQILENFSIWL